MLSLLSTILQWDDDEREKAGLQRTSAIPSSGSSIWGRATSPSSAKGKAPELEKTDETEVRISSMSIYSGKYLSISRQSFSRLWVEFLLTEAAAGEGTAPPPKSPGSRTNTSLPGTPTRPTSHLSPNSFKTGSRLPSFTSAAMASSPNLALQSPSRKGKEKALDTSP
ncbi:hypothetical protein QCA50_015587 [Cerrena zonata]|uniref:Uncharacterized protein n=1 Tax=Cerrena zonata TaxID=2478898 RepID=A0AAW0FJ72_9APHY